MTREEALNKVRQMSLPKETMEILEALAPELAESENERIRKTLIDALKTSKSVGELKFILPEPTREECLAYLEKQGEQKVSVDDFKAKDWYVSKVDGKIHNIYYSVDKVKPKFKVGDKIIEKNFDECGRGTIIDIKDGKYIFDDGGFICIEEQGLWKLVEQKPTEYIKRNSKEWYSLLAEQYDKGFWKGKAEQKPAEWSEEDEDMLQNIIQEIEWERRNTTVDKDIRNYDRQLNFLKSLPLKLKKENEEWRHYIWAINMKFDYTALIKYDNTDNYEIVQAGNRPKQEKNGVYILIKDIKPQSHWKPSEEQMKALSDACCIAFEEERDFHPSLSRLHHDLRKL